MTDLQIRILTIGGLLLAINAFVPPMINQNVFTATGLNKSTRHFFFVRQVNPPTTSVSEADRPARQFRQTLQIDYGRLTAQSFLILGATIAAIGIAWPERVKHVLKADGKTDSEEG